MADAVELEKADGSVNVENISFSYRKEVPLLQNISIDVKPGQRIAIVGPTGCGKTTMINLLMRFYDVDKGQIVVSGHPIRELTRDSQPSQEFWYGTSGDLVKSRYDS